MTFGVPPVSTKDAQAYDYANSFDYNQTPLTHVKMTSRTIPPREIRWLKRHPRFHLHFTPTSSSWLNMVERWFGEITQKRIRRGTFKSVNDLLAAISEYLDEYNRAPKRFEWTKNADMILAKIERCKAALVTPH